MKQSVKDEWVTELRSGNYQQGQGSLRTSDDKYCCLGVLCEIAVKHQVIPPAVLDHSNYKYGVRDDNPGSVQTAYLPLTVQEWAEVHRDDPAVKLPSVDNDQDLAELNDAGLTFDQIADVIEQFL